VNQEIDIHNSRVYLYTGIKVVGLLIAFIGFYALIYAKGSQLGWLFLAYIGVGVTSIMIFLNVVHDAAHNALFRSKFLNQISQHFLELLGTNSYIWKMRHVRLHHSFPNVLIEILDALFRELERHLHGWFGRSKRAKALIQNIRSQLSELKSKDDSREETVKATNLAESGRKTGGRRRG